MKVSVDLVPSSRVFSRFVLIIVVVHHVGAAIAVADERRRGDRDPIGVVISVTVRCSASIMSVSARMVGFSFLLPGSLFGASVKSVKSVIFHCTLFEPSLARVYLRI